MTDLVDAKQAEHWLAFFDSCERTAKNALEHSLVSKGRRLALTVIAQAEELEGIRISLEESLDEDFPKSRHLAVACVRLAGRVTDAEGAESRAWDEVNQRNARIAAQAEELERLRARVAELEGR